MTRYAVDRLVFTPDDVDLSRSPLAGKLGRETHVVGAFNPGLTRLSNGNLLMMVRVTEALRKPTFDGKVHAIRWSEEGYVLDGWPLELADTADPRRILLRGEWRVAVPTALSWLLPVELAADGLSVVAVHYDRAVAPEGSFQCYGLEDARISRVGDHWLMTAAALSPERQSTTLYTSADGLDWRFDDIILDHQNGDMLIFEGLIDGRYWAQTRPLGDHYFAYPPGSEWRAGPSINLATSPDARHWKPYLKPGIRPHAATASTARMGGGAPPILSADGWLSLWYGVAPKEIVGSARTYWSLLDRDDPSVVVRTKHPPLLEPNPALTERLADRVHDVVFTTGLVDAGDHYIVASGEADLACRITHIPKSAFA